MSGRRAQIVVIAALAALTLYAAHIEQVTHVRRNGDVYTVFGVMVVWTFAIAGVVAWRRRPANRTGRLMVATGFVWLAGALSESPNDLVFTVGVLVGNLWAALLIHLLLAYPTGTLEGRSRWIAAAAYASTFGVSALVLPFTDPRLDSDGFSPRSASNAALVSHRPGLVHALDSLATIAGVVIIVACVVTVWRRWRSAPPAQRRVLAPVYLTGVVTIGVLLAVVTVFAATGSSDSALLFYGFAISLTAVPLSYLFGILRTRLDRSSAVETMLATLREQRVPGGLRDVLRVALDDPTLDLAYRRSGGEGYVDVHGEPYPLADAPAGRAVTTIERDGAAVAAIVHDRHLLDDPGLIDAVCAPAALAIENERLQAELRAQVQEVQASERRLRDVLENVRLVAVSTDVEGRITFANRFLCDLAGYAPEELVGRDWAETFNPGSTIAAQLASGTSRSHEEAPLRTRSGDVRAMEWSTTVTRDADGRVDGGTGIGLDVTERNRAAAELRDLARQQAALRRVATAVAAADEPERIFALVTEEVARLLSGDTANLIRFDDGGAYTVVGEWSLRAGSGVPIGDSGPLDPRTAAGTVAATGRPARVDYADVEGELAGVLRALGIRASVAAPISVQGRLWGAIRVSTTGDRGLPADAETRIAEFTELVALALSNADAHTQLRASRARIVAAGDSERRRLERNLHDGAQQRLVALSLALRMARSAVDGNPAAGELLESASAELMQALEELRELARGIHPAVLTDRGLEAAVDMLAARSPVPVRATIDLDRRETDPQVQAAVYYVIAESLTNVAKYAGARSVQVAVTSDGRLATVRVVDDGGGGATPVRGGGLSGLTDRVEALGGTLTVVSPPRAGTVVSATLPLEARIAPAARLVGAARAAGDGDRAAETR